MGVRRERWSKSKRRIIGMRLLRGSSAKCALSHKRLLRQPYNRSEEKEK